MENIETLLAAVAQTQGFDDDEPLDSRRNSIRVETEPVQLNGASCPPPVAAIEKRKRGRPPKAKVAVKPPPPVKRMKEEDEEEDVCFICFDGGSLVLCDRKGCPKAYHTSCIKRDEAFFKSKAKWNCGWHICIVCQKTSHYMCYTCTYSLCKTCSKDADYTTVRGNKGFCPTCMKTIMLIENKDQANNDSVQVDFDDQTSWEYLFKVYWVYLKEKLSLTLSELNRAKNSGRGVAAVACMSQSNNAHQTSLNEKQSVLHQSSKPLELKKLQEFKEVVSPRNIKLKGASGIDNHVKTLNSTVKEEPASYEKNAKRPRTRSFTAKASIDKSTDEPSLGKATDKSCIEKGEDKPRIVDDTDKPCICRTKDKPGNKDPDKPETGDSTGRASSSGKEGASLKAQNIVTEETDANGSHGLERHIYQINVANSAVGSVNDQVMERSGMETETATASGRNSPTANCIETEKLWHYRDLNGTILGPFSLLLLQKWSTTGLLPTDMRIWQNHEHYDSIILADALSRQFNGESEMHCDPSDSLEHGTTDEIEGSEGINGIDRYSKQIEPTCSKRSSDLSDSNTGCVRVENSSPSTWPQCWDLLKDGNSGADDVQMHNVVPPSSVAEEDVAPRDQGEDSGESNHCLEDGENISSGLAQNQITNRDESQNLSNNQAQVHPSSEGNLSPLHIDLSSHAVRSESVFAPTTSPVEAGRQNTNGVILDLHNPTAETSNEHWGVQTAIEQQSVSSVVPVQKSGFLELLSLTPRSSNQDQAVEKTQSNLIGLPFPNSIPNWSISSSLPVGALLAEVADDEWCGKRPLQEWDCGLVSAPSVRPPEVVIEDLTISNANNNQLTNASPTHPASNTPNWLSLINEPIEFDALGEESISDLLAEVDAMESQGGMPSPTSAVKFAKEFLQYCKDDCFSSFDEFGPGKSDALSSTGEVQLTPLPIFPCKPNEIAPIDTLDFFKKSGMRSSTSSEGESSAPVYSGEAGTEFRRPAPKNTSRDIIGANIGTVSEAMDPGCGTVQGNVNLVTVQGNVNLVLGGPAQGATNLGWGTNNGVPWANPGTNLSPINGDLQWDGQRKHGGERFASPRERSYQGNEKGFLRSKPPWGRQSHGGGGYSRPSQKVQRVCKFYESGRCKKGSFCDFLHP